MTHVNAPSRRMVASILASLGIVAVTATTAHAATTERVTEATVTRQAEDSPPTSPWVLYTRAGTPPTAGSFVEGPAGAPLGTGSLRLQTATGSEKVFLFNFDHVGTALRDVDDIAYSTYRAAGDAQQVAALNVVIDYNGSATGGFSTLVFEPVYNTDQGAVTTGEWQDWMADGSGTWWSTWPISGQCSGATADCDKTWDEIVANNPDAVVLGGVGVNQGSGNPGLVTNADAFTFDETTYDFESTNSKDECKDGGWENFTNPSFKNQGDCVSYFSRS